MGTKSDKSVFEQRDSAAQISQTRSVTAGKSEIVHVNEDNTSQRNCIISYTSNDDEIIWAIKSILSHYSLNFAVNIKDVFKLMFRDSSIAKKLAMGSTKLLYYITYGLDHICTKSLYKIFLVVQKLWYVSMRP